MKLLIVTTPFDHSLKRITEEAKKKGHSVRVVMYAEVDKEVSFQHLASYDYCIARDPYWGSDYSSLVPILSSLFTTGNFLDQRTHTLFPSYEDKVFQHQLFSPVPRYWTFAKKTAINLPFPIVAKKRISSRTRGVYVLENKQVLNKLLEEHSLDDLFFEELIAVEHDLRVVVLNNTILCAVKRTPYLKTKNSFTSYGLKVSGKIRVTERICSLATQTAKAIQADFCGVDIVLDKNNTPYILECNLAPQFISTERESKVNIARHLISFIEQQLQ